MKIRSSALAALALMPFLFACSSNDDTGKDADPSEEDPPVSTDTCDPTGKIPCVEDLAEPCEGLNSGFEGDEYCMKPPTNGYQLHVGPKDYHDPVDTERYMIDAGEETNWADIQTSENEETIFSDGYISHMRPGSHHFILFALNEGSNLNDGMQASGEGAESAVGALNGTFRAGATRAVQDAQVKSDLPEDQGIAAEMKGKQQYAVNIHFVNIGDTPLLQEIWVNFHSIAEGDIKRWTAPVTWYGGLGMRIQPGVHTTLASAEGSCKAPEDNMRILGLTGHVHASTIRYNAEMMRAGETERTVMFEDYDWHEPTEFRYTGATPNTPADPEKKVRGGYSGVLNVGKTDNFYWECEIENKTTSVLTFSNKVYDGEMCNVFGFYASDTRNAAPWMCAFF